ncbi:threonylcarbamoyl-AMP synthase-like [Dysidea avara]|uniref:threonylcarbamoyl-AMP synthase-like n=1 Tax=Dysidea avara TaxID=196820 RepID=UPI003328E617
MANVIKVNTQSDESIIECLPAACEVLDKGGVIAMPTDTIYGVAAKVSVTAGIQRIYNLKGRDQSKPLAICCSDISQITRWSNCSIGEDILKELLPGPFTLILERSTKLNPDLNPGVQSVGIRIPDSALCIKLVAQLGEPIALTSANISGKSSAISIEEFKELWSEVDVILDGGPCNQQEDRRGSTIIDFTVPGKFSIVRVGSLCDETVKLLTEKYGMQNITRQ